jgi:endonuclease/exonuclease/phosphatase (EEP) superfamily protein YafD
VHVQIYRGLRTKKGLHNAMLVTMFSRLLAFVVSLASMVLVVIAFWPQLLGWQRTSPWSFMVAPRGFALAIALLTVIVLIVLGRFGRPLRRVLMAAGSWLLVFAIATGVLLYFRGLGAPMPSAPPISDTASLRVLEWNTMGDAPAPAAIAQVALDSGAQVITLPETTATTAHDVASIMRQAGVDVQALTVAYDEIYRAHSTSVLIARSLGQYRVADGAAQTSVSPTIVAVSTDGGPTIVAAHVVAPSQVTMPQWRADLEVLANLCGEPDVILAGDLNATIDNMQGLGAKNIGNCVDAALATHGAALGTWPTWLPTLGGTPIDHVMATPEWRITGSTVLTSVDGAGSDHRPLLAQLSRVG